MLKLSDTLPGRLSAVLAKPDRKAVCIIAEAALGFYS